MNTAQLNGHKRAVLSCRVSTKDQKDHGTSPEKQMEAGWKYSQDNDFEIVGNRWYDLKQKRSVSEPNENTFPVPVYMDDFTGTVPIEQRPEGSKAFALLSEGKADILIVFSIDRLVRPKEDGDEWDIPPLIRGLAKLGREIHTVEDGKINSTFEGLLIAVIRAKAAGDERRRILGRMTDGKQRKAKKMWVGNSSAPYGLRKVGEKKECYLEIDPEEAAIKRRMFDLYLGLNGETAIGLESMAVLFNAEGIPVTGRLHDEKKRPLADRVWRPSTIHAIMSNRACIGEFTWAGEVVTIPDLAIIDRAIFDAAMEQRKINRVLCKRNVHYNYLLQSRLTCTCGRKMSAINIANNGKTYLYYRCSRKQFDPGSDCDRMRIVADLGDRVAWNWLIDVFKNREKLLAGLYEYQARQQKKAEPNKARLAELPRLKADCEAQAQALTRSLARVPKDDELTAKSIEDTLSQISAAHKRFCQEYDRLAAEVAAIEVGEADVQQILEWAEEIGQAIDQDAISFQARRKIVERLNVTAQVEYQNNVRGLRLDCPVLSASKWRKLAAIADNSS